MREIIINRFIFMRNSVGVVVILCACLPVVTSCGVGGENLTFLNADDFKFTGPLGSEGAQIAQIDTNHFKITLDHAPSRPKWPNNLYFEIEQNARGNNLRLEVEFRGGSSYAFNSYFQSWSYNGEDWQPIQWELGSEESPQLDELIFPTFTEDRVYVGFQVPMSFEIAESMMKEWSEHPDATLHTVGTSIQGRPLYRLEIANAESSIAPENRWVHYFANQHPGEHNSQWRMAGMVDWILSNDGADFRERNISHFIFFMSPDASGQGWYRVNAEGVDMNRSYRPEGASQEEQTHEAYLWQKDLEGLMQSEEPITTIWAMHTWQGIVEPLLKKGPEIGSTLEPWTVFRDILEENDPDTLIKPLAVRDGEPGYGTVSWTEGPHEQFGITAVLCEGGGSLYTKEENIASGEILINSIAEYYNGEKP